MQHISDAEYAPSLRTETGFIQTYSYQQRLAADPLPDLLNIPTGMGKADDLAYGEALCRGALQHRDACAQAFVFPNSVSRTRQLFRLLREQLPNRTDLLMRQHASRRKGGWTELTPPPSMLQHGMPAKIKEDRCSLEERPIEGSESKKIPANALQLSKF